MVEHRIPNPVDGGSSPSRPADIVDAAGISGALVIPQRLPGLNEIIDAKGLKLNRFSNKQYSEWTRVKKKWNAVVDAATTSQDFFVAEPSYYTWIYLEPNRKRDPDNFSSGAKKIVLDGLQSAGMLENDGWKHVLGHSDYWFHRKDDPAVVLIVSNKRCLVPEEAFFVFENLEESLNVIRSGDGVFGAEPCQTQELDF